MLTVKPARTRARALRADNGGILLILAAIVLIVTMNTIAKHLATDGIPVLQLVWARFVFHLLTALPIVILFYRPQLRTARPATQIGRSAILLGMNICFFFGLKLMPLAEVTSMMFAAPLFLIGLSVAILGETVGPRRWLGVAAGFAGIFMILKPSAEMDIAYLVPLGAAFLYSCYQLITRLISAGEHPVTTFLYTPVAGAVLITAVLPWIWVMPDAKAWALMVLTGMLGAIGHLLLINAYKRSEASLLAPFSYSSILWASLFGWLFFGWLPDAWAIGGAVLIVASGLYIWQRERQLKKAKAAAPGADAAP